MKRILFAALLLCFAFTSNAQMATNNAYCDLKITRYCFDASCTAVSINSFLLTAGSSVPISSCPGGYRTVWVVCWATAPCGLGPTCVKIDGNVPMSICGPGTYTGNIISCDFCANTSAGASVTFNPFSGDLIINP